MAFWWCIYRQIRSREVHYCSRLLTDEYFINDNFFDYNTLKNYSQEFTLMFNQVFGQFPSASLKYYARYQRGLITYHSLMYTRRFNSNSYSVCVKNDNDPTKLLFSYGEIIFFFYFNDEPFFFFKRYMRSKKSFSSLMNPIEHISNWNLYVDKYYKLVRHSSSEFIILPCAAIIHKCIFVLLSDEYSVWTPVELELEHD